jgi:ribonuclease BN (tRNA processing enzyme)
MLIQQLHLSGRRHPLAVYGPAEYARRLPELLGVHYLFVEALRFDLVIRGLEAGTGFEVCGIQFVASATRHLEPAAARVAELGYANTCEAFAIQFQVDGRTILYSGDVNAFEDIRRAITGCDLALVDSTHIDLETVLSWAGDHPRTHVILSHVAEDLDTQVLALELAKTGMDTVRVAREGEIVEV